MSQPNDNGYNISLNINGEPVPYYDSRATQATYNVSFHQPWPQRTSPSPTVMSASNQGSFSSNQGMSRPGNLQHSNSIDMNMHPSHLAPPQIRSRSSLENANANFAFNDFNTSGAYDEPWSAVRMRNSSIPTNSRPAYPQANFGSYRERGPSSDIDSGPPHSDSGYFTHQTHSVVSNNEPERVGQELPAVMTFAVNNLNMMGGSSVASEPTEVVPLMQSDQISQYSGISTHSKTPLVCQHCSETSKCPSDHKKHVLRHVKPHTCDHPGCRRAHRGFTTKNDLDRHKKSVHRINVEKDSYQCASEHCRNKGKIWPRLDNFKQHIARMHKDEDDLDLIRRSSYQFIYPPGEMSVAPLDTTLAGMGSEKHLGNKLDDLASAISLTPDQDFDDRPKWSNQGFNRDVDRTNPDTLDFAFSAPNSQQQQQGSSNATSSNRTGKQRQNSLSVLAEAADHIGKSTRKSLSNAPQTKAEQQRQAAMQKFSKAMAEEIRNDPSGEVDLQEVVMRVLQDVANQVPRSSSSSDSSDQDVSSKMTKAEALKASQAISSLIKQTNVPTSHSSKAAASANRGVTCKICSTTLARCCDLRKHMKRHTRPYGCTFPGCYKRFGAKSDWKRHENSQHFQIEAFLCHRPLPSLTPATCKPEPCNQVFYNEKLFEKHLSKVHEVDSKQRIQKEMEERRIGKNGQGQFWCGFCRQIVKLQQSRNAAWDERFDHIDHHFSREEKSIDDWICLERSRPKSELRVEYERTKETNGVNEEDVNRDESEEKSPDPTPDYDDVGEGPSQSSYEAPPAPSMLFHAQDLMPDRMMSASSKKRHIPMDESMAAPRQKKSKRDGFSRYCCGCKGGPWPVNNYMDCIDCSHRLCSFCLVVNDAEGFNGNMYVS